MLARAFVLALVAVPCLAALPGSAGSNAPQSPFGDVTLTASPSKFHGSCPVRIRFVARVGIAAHPMVFNYHFERSDGAKSETKLFRVTNEHTRTVELSETWQLGEAGQHMQVWEKLLVASGNTRITSNQADADITCR